MNRAGAITADPDLVVLTGRCHERDRLPYCGVDDVVDCLSQFWKRLPYCEAMYLLPCEPELLARLFPVLARVPEVARAKERWGKRPVTRDVVARAGESLRETLYRLARRRRLALFVDDLQWVGAETLSLLARVMEPPHPPPLLLILANRGAAAGKPHAELAQRLSGISLELHLTPLSAHNTTRPAGISMPTKACG